MVNSEAFSGPVAAWANPVSGAETELRYSFLSQSKNFLLYSLER
jgi:hypothetical protein